MNRSRYKRKPGLVVADGGGGGAKRKEKISQKCI
jgi:hypothetical protein